MRTLTVSEALAHLDTLRKLAERKQAFVAGHLVRGAALRDPLADAGGTRVVVARELESLARLRERHVLLRRLIHKAYEHAPLTIGDETRSVANWLIWKREVATRKRIFLQRLNARIGAARRKAGVAYVVHLDEQQLAREVEQMVQALGQFAGLLQLKNATLTIDVPPDDWETGINSRLFEHARPVEPAPVASAGSPWASEELRRLALDPTQKIAAIKLYRQMTRCGLAEAKQAVEAFARGELA